MDGRAFGGHIRSRQDRDVLYVFQRYSEGSVHETSVAAIHASGVSVRHLQGRNCGAANGLPVALWLLRWREVLTLRSAAILHDGRLELILGPSGSGKSTLAAQVAESEVIADDHVHIRLKGQQLRAATPSWDAARDASPAGADAQLTRVTVLDASHSSRAAEQVDVVGSVVGLGFSPEIDKRAFTLAGSLLEHLNASRL